MMQKKLVRTSLFTMAFIMLLLATTQGSAYSVAEKAQKRRIEIIGYLRLLKPMVYNFPCEPFPECYAELKKNDKLEDAQRIKMYLDLKKIYQEGMVYYYEGQYLKAYNRFLDSQTRTENILEQLSLFYITRTQIMMRDSLEKKNPEDPSDMTVVDVSIEYGPNSRKRRDFADDREAPHSIRRYNAKEVHWAQNKWQIEQNVKKGYEYLGLARQARNDALLVDVHLAKDKGPTTYIKQKRIENYLIAIKHARQAKMNAAYIYQLKYPYDNYVLFNKNGLTENKGTAQPGEKQSIENVSMNWTFNPYVYPEKLHPVFDLRVPARYRRDTTDSRNMIYEEEVDINIEMKYFNEERRNKIKDLNYETTATDKPNP